MMLVHHVMDALPEQHLLAMQSIFEFILFRTICCAQHTHKTNNKFFDLDEAAIIQIETLEDSPCVLPLNFKECAEIFAVVSAREFEPLVSTDLFRTFYVNGFEDLDQSVCHLPFVVMFFCKRHLVISLRLANRSLGLALGSLSLALEIALCLRVPQALAEGAS